MLYVIQHIKADAMSGEGARQMVTHPEVRIIFIYTKCTDEDKRLFALIVPFVVGGR